MSVQIPIRHEFWYNAALTGSHQIKTQSTISAKLSTYIPPELHALVMVNLCSNRSANTDKKEDGQMDATNHIISLLH